MTTGFLPGFSHPAKGTLFLIGGPSGAGKGRLLARLMRTLSGLAFSVSVTSRAPRSDEKNGVEYWFRSLEDCEALKRQGAFLEYAEVYGVFYGTLREPVLHALAAGRSIILEIDIRGKEQVMLQYPDAITIFVAPASMTVLRERLEGRGTDVPEVIERRLRESALQFAERGGYDYQVLNSDIEWAYVQLQSIFIAEFARTLHRADWIKEFA